MCHGIVSFPLFLRGASPLLTPIRPGWLCDSGSHLHSDTGVAFIGQAITQREDFTGVAVPFYEGHLHADTLPMFRAMNAALAQQAAR